MDNKRKPHSGNAGYICELKNRLTGVGHVVVYRAKEAQLDPSGGPYAVVCETHSTMVMCTSLPKARTAMKAVDFCEECAEMVEEPDGYGEYLQEQEMVNGDLTAYCG